MLEKKYSQPANKYTVLLCVSLLCLLEFFSFQKMIGTDALFGDLGDGRLTNLVAEHWFHFFKGEAAFADLGTLYPAENTLAYSDMLLGFGILHTLLRFAGLNMYLAYKYTILLVHAVGTFSTYYLLRRVLDTNNIWALFGSIAFSFSDSIISALVHTQLAAFCLLPIVSVFVIRFFQNLKCRKKRNLYAYSAITVIVLILYTSWYTAFFLALFAVITLLTGMAVLAVNQISIKKTLSDLFHILQWDLAGYILVSVLLVLPFIFLELPIMKMAGGYDFSGLSIYMPEPIDVIHVSGSNWLLGRWMRESAIFQGKSSEVKAGFSIVLLLAFLGSFITLFIKGRREKNRAITGKIIMIIISISIIVGILIMLKYGNGFSPWKYVYSFFPGAKAIRAVGRGLLFLSFPMAIVTAVMLNELDADSLMSKKQPILSVVGKFLLVIALVLTEINTVGPMSAWNAEDSFKRVESVSEPPEDCKSFFLSNPLSTLTEPYLQTDAWEIADYLNLKTINGYSGTFPTGWGGIWNIRSDIYKNAVWKWIDDHQIENVYEYDQTANAWLPAGQYDEYEYEYTFGDDEFSKNCETAGHIRRIHDGGVSYGPYLYAPESSTVEVTITGNHLDYSDIDVYSLNESLSLEPVYEKQTDSEIIFVIVPSVDLTSLEVAISNKTEDSYLGDIALMSERIEIKTDPG